MKNKIFLLIGKSGAGKDSIAKEICKSMNLDFAVSFTTRPRRQGEVEGREYKFITYEEFVSKYSNNEIAEHVYYEVINDEGQPDFWYYGLGMDELTKSNKVIAIVNPKGYKVLSKNSRIKDTLVSILIETDCKDRLTRCLNRENMTEEKCAEVCRRYLCDSVDFKDIMCDYIVYNDNNLENAIDDVRNIILKEIVEVI